MSMSTKYLAILIMSLPLLLPACQNRQNYDAFAKCLSDGGVKMWGAYWCSHCNNQKEMFGDSFQYITYVECSLPERAGQTEECEKAGIKGYPTWENGNGERVSGEMTILQLSQFSGCKLEG